MSVIETALRTATTVTRLRPPKGVRLRPPKGSASARPKGFASSRPKGSASARPKGSTSPAQGVRLLPKGGLQTMTVMTVMTTATVAIPAPLMAMLSGSAAIMRRIAVSAT